MDFKEELIKARGDKEKVKKVMDLLDEDKRKLRADIDQLAFKLNGMDRTTSIPYRKKMDFFNRKLGYLISLRSEARNTLARIKREDKSLRRAVNGKSILFSKAFIAAAEQLLSEDVYLQLELKASQIMEDHEANYGVKEQLL